MVDLEHFFISGDDSVSVCDSSVYDEYDPYDFIYVGSGSNSLSDPMYAAVAKSEINCQSPPPLPPRTKSVASERRKLSRDGLVSLFL